VDASDNVIQTLISPMWPKSRGSRASRSQPMIMLWAIYSLVTLPARRRLQSNAWLRGQQHHRCEEEFQQPVQADRHHYARNPCRLDNIQRRLHMHLVRFVSFKDGQTANHEPTDVNALELKMFGMTTWMDGLQHLIESELRAEEMITPLVASSTR
jgi:hypothetical protein